MATTANNTGFIYRSSLDAIDSELPTAASDGAPALQDIEMASASEQTPVKRPSARLSEEKDDEMDDLFGDEEGETHVRQSNTAEQSRSTSVHESDGGPAAEELARRKAMEYEEDDEAQPETVQLREASVSIPNFPVPTSSDNTYWSIRTPNFIKIDSRPFLAETYVGPDEDIHQDEDSRLRSMGIKLEVQNTMRWRWREGPDGSMIKQSNSRIIRWSDGSMSLQLGKEMFEVQANVDPYVSRLRAAATTATASAISPTPSGSQSQPQSQSQTPNPSQSTSTSTPTPKGGPTYLVAQHKRAQILQTERLLTGTLTLLPTSMGGTHQMLVRAVGQRHNKVSRLRMAPDPLRDPEKENMELAKNQVRLRAKAKKGDGSTTRKRSSYARERRSRPDLSDDEDDEPDYGSDDDGLSPRRREVRKRKSPKRDVGDYETDDFVVEDTEEEDEGGGGGSGGGGAIPRKRSKNDEMSDDSLDELENKLEMKRKRQKEGRTASPVIAATPAKEKEKEKTPAVEGTDDMDMSVESEEADEDEPAVRRPGVGSRKKIVVDEDDEE